MAQRVVFMGKDRKPSLYYEELATPDIHDGQILAKVRLATICGSDLHTIKGTREEALPSVLGHEAVVEVVLNKRRDCDLRPGDRATFSVIDCCNRCRFCRLGLPQKCRHLHKYGHMLVTETRGGFNGCYASHIILEQGTTVLKLPDEVTDQLAAPINCALATMVNAVSDVLPGDAIQRVVIQGAGLLGLYGCALLHERGVERVYCTDTCRQRLVAVPAFGATPLNTADTNVPGYDEQPEDGSVDVVIEVCGCADVVEAGLRYLRPGGTYIVVGLVHGNSTLAIRGDVLIRKCLTIKGVHNYSPAHLEQAVAFISETKDKYPYSSLLNPTTYCLKDLALGLEAAQTRQFHRVAVTP